MSAPDTAQAADLPPLEPEPLAAADVPVACPAAEWLLAGGWFTVGLGGAITAWSKPAEETWGLERHEAVGSPFAERLLAPAARSEHGAAIEAVLGGEGESFAAEVTAAASSGETFTADIAIVTIRTELGYDLNDLLQDVTKQTKTLKAVAALRQRHVKVLSRIEAALRGEGAVAAETEAGARLAGALVMFDPDRHGSAPPKAAKPAPEPAAAPPAESAAGDAALPEATREALDAALRDALGARTEITGLQAQLEEARREAQRARNEAEAARQAASEARDAEAGARGDAEQARQQVEDARRQLDEARAATESTRIRTEEAQREIEELRSQLREARESASGAAGRIEGQLAKAREEAERATAELGESREELGRAKAEVERLAGELERATGDAERSRDEAAAARTELDRAKAALKAAAGDTTGSAELDDLRSATERFRRAFERAPIGTVLTDADGRILHVNRALCHTLGHSAERLLADEPPALIHPDDAAAKNELARRLLTGDQWSARGHRRYVHADGHAITMRESVSLVRDSNGDPSMFVFQLEEAHGEDGMDHVVVDAEIATDEVQPLPHSADSQSLAPASVRRALTDDMFTLHCQPVLDLASNDVRQHELLIRMVGEDGRLYLPETFLGAARRAGLAHEIDRWVVRQAIGLIRHNEQQDRDVRIEVNLSPEALDDMELPALLEEEIAATGIDPGSLILEVTGSTAIADLEGAKRLAKTLRALGCRFALDDFHSTFGSFRYLKELPIDYLKLDGELIGSLAESKTSELIIKALVEVAHGTSTKTVAVFVSDDDTLELLRELKVDFAQGYTVGRPRAVAEVWPSGPAELPAGD